MFHVKHYNNFPHSLPLWGRWRGAPDEAFPASKAVRHVSRETRWAYPSSMSISSMLIPRCRAKSTP